MIIPTTLYRYIGRQFLIWFGAVLLLALMLVFIGNFVELTRRTATHPEVGVGTLAEMAALQMPQTGEELLPFAVLLGTILALWRLTRTQELIVVRAVGISVWQFLAPMVMLAFLIGAVGVTIFNPIASSMLGSFKRLEARLLKNSDDSLMLSSAGFWLRQSNGDGTQAVIHANHLSQPEMALDGVTIYFFHVDDTLHRRLDAASARLEAARWRLADVHEWRVEQDGSRHYDTLFVPTMLTAPKIEESFASPETMSFWTLPSFIELLEQSGFSAQRHRVFFDSLLARPFLLCAMVLLAATFALRMQRRGGTTLLLVAGIGTGFLVWFLTDVVSALGTSGAIPAGLAAWTPAGIAALIGTTLLLYLEDG